MPLGCSEPLAPAWRRLRDMGRCRRPAGLAAIAIVAQGLLRPDAGRASVDQGWVRGVFPVVGFLAYTSSFGPRLHPVSGTVRDHDGIDIAAPLGAPVRSWWSGRIVEVIRDDGCGNGLVIRSGDYEHIYCHLADPGAPPPGRPQFGAGFAAPSPLGQGQRVAAGQVIGRVGLSGATTGPHLHWGLRYRGLWLDPARVLRAMAASRRVSRFGLARRPNVGLFRQDSSAPPVHLRSQPP